MKTHFQQMWYVLAWFHCSLFSLARPVSRALVVWVGLGGGAFPLAPTNCEPIRFREGNFTSREIDFNPHPRPPSFFFFPQRRERDLTCSREYYSSLTNLLFTTVLFMISFEVKTETVFNCFVHGPLISCSGGGSLRRCRFIVEIPHPTPMGVHG